MIAVGYPVHVPVIFFITNISKHYKSKIFEKFGKNHRNSRYLLFTIFITMRFNGFCEATLKLVQEAARAGYPLCFDWVVLDQVHPLLRGVHAIVAGRKRVVDARDILQVPARPARAAALAYVVGATF